MKSSFKLALAATAISSVILSSVVMAAAGDEYGTEQEMSIKASGTKASASNGFFAFPDNDLKFTYDPSVGKFVPQDEYGIGFYATVINEVASAASEFKLEAKTIGDNKILSRESQGEGFVPEIAIGDNVLTSVYQVIDPLADLGIDADLTEVTDAAGNRFEGLTMSVKQGRILGGASSAAELPVGIYGGNVSLKFKATWTE